MAPAKQSVQVKQMVSTMEGFEERVMKQLEVLNVLQEKVEVIDSVKEKFEELGSRFEKQV